MKKSPNVDPLEFEGDSTDQRKSPPHIDVNSAERRIKSETALTSHRVEMITDQSLAWDNLLRSFGLEVG